MVIRTTLFLIIWLLTTGLTLGQTMANEKIQSSKNKGILESMEKVSLTPEEKRYLTGLGPIKVCPDPDWIPFEHVDEHGNFTGIAADLLHLLAQRLNIEFTYVFPANWDEAVALSKSGQVHILPFLNQTPAREEWLVFTEPLMVDPNVFITREEHPYIADISQLSNKTIVFPTGTSMEERIRRDFPNLIVANVQRENEVFQAVSNRSADMTLRSLTIAAYTIRKEGLFNLKIAGQAPDNYINRMRLGVLKSEPMLRDILNKGIALLSPGEREEIINRHVNITVIKPMDYVFILKITTILAAMITLSFYWNYRLKRINRALNESERSKSVLLSNLPGMAYRCLFDHNWTMEFVSEGCLSLTGYKNEDLVQNRLISYNELIMPEDREWIRQKWEDAQSSRNPVQLEYRILTADQKEKWVFDQGVFIYDNEHKVKSIEGLIIDINGRKQAEEALYLVSIHDHLTCIYNRRYIFDRLDIMIQEHQREDQEFSISIIDLDFFKAINDTYGHPAGDFILKEFATILTNSFRPYDLVGRFGGEEFIVITMNINMKQTEDILNRVRKTVKDHVFNFNGTHLKIAFSAGITHTLELESEITVEKMIQKADQRLYLAKDQGRDRIISRD